MILGLAGIVALTAGFLVLTESGLGLVLRQAGSLAPGSLAIEKVEGRLLGPIGLEGVRYVDGDLEIEVEDVRIEWRPAFLLAGRVQIKRFNLSGLKVRLPSAGDGEVEERVEKGPPSLRAPLGIRLEEGIFKDLTFSPPGGQDYKAEQILVRGSINRRGILLRKLEITARPLELEAEGRISADPEGPLEARLGWSFQPGDSPPLEGKGEVSGTWGGVMIKHSLTSPFRADLAARIERPMESPAGDLDLTFENLSPLSIAPGLPEGEVSGKISARGSPNSFSLAASLGGALAEVEDLRASLSLTRQGPVWNMEHGRIEAASTGMRLDVSGRLDTADEETPLDLSAEWSDLAWPPGSGDPLWASGRGKISVEGRRREFQAALEAFVQGKGIQPGPWTASGRGTSEGFTLDSFRILLLDGELEGSGFFHWKNGLAWGVTGGARGLDPAKLKEDWPGRLSFSLKASSEEEGNRRVSVEVSNISGDLRGRKIAGSLEGSSDGWTHRAQRLELSLGTTVFRAAGQVGEVWDVRADFRTGDAGVLVTGASGSANASLAIKGPRLAPRLQGLLKGQDLGYGPAGASALEVSVDAPMDRAAQGSLRVSAESLSWGEGPAGSLDLEGKGSWESHQVELKTGLGGGASLALEGKGAQKSWQGELMGSVLTGSVRGGGGLRWTGGPAWDGSIRVDRVDPGTIWPGFPGDLSFTLEGEGKEGQEGGEWSVRLSDLGGKLRDLPVSGSAEVEGRGERILVRTGKVRVGEAALEGSGGIGPDTDLNVEISVPDLGSLVPGTSGTFALEGRISGRSPAFLFSVKGSGSGLSVPPAAIEELSFSAEAGAGFGDPVRVDLAAAGGKLGGQTVESMRMSARGTLASHQIDISIKSPVWDAEALVSGQYREGGWAGTAEGMALGGTFEAEGDVGWIGPIRWEAAFRGTDLRPEMLGPAFPENLSLSIESLGESGPEGTRAEVRVDDLAGVHRERPIRGKMDVGILPEGLEVRNMDLGIGGGTLNASGRLLESWDLDWAMDLPDLSSLVEGFEGMTSGSGRVTGSRHAPRVSGKLTGRGLAFGSSKVQQILVDADISADPSEDSRARIDVSGFSAGALEIQSGSLTASGPIGSHRLSVTARSPVLDADMEISGGFHDGSWTGKVNRWQVDSEELGNWSLAGTAPLGIGDILLAGPLCLESGAAEVCLGGKWEPGEDGEGFLRWSGLDLDLAGAGLPRGVRLEGTSEGEVLWEAQGVAFSLSGRLRTSAGSVAYSPEDGAGDVEVSFRRFAADVILDEAGLRGRAEADLVNEGGGEEQVFGLMFEVPDFSVPAAPGEGDLGISGQLRARVDDLALLEAFVPELSRVTGLLVVDLTLGGSLGNPVLGGALSLSEGAFRLATPGISVEEVDFKAEVRPGNLVEMRGSMFSGGGKAEVEGSIALVPSEGWPLDLSLSGERFEVARTPSIRMLVSPELKMESRGEEIRITGAVRVPEASIEPMDISAARTPSPDVRVTGRKESPEPSGLKIHSEVTLETGEKVFFKGYGLTGRIAGRVTITERPDGPASGTGEFQVLDGEYRAFGQVLKIRRGRLVFTGSPIDNPGLDIRAVRQVGEVTAGVEIDGTLLSPRLALFSEPAMEEAEALSYLVLGRPLYQATSEDARLLSQAATAVSLAGGLAIARRIGSVFGIEEVRIEAGESSEDSTLVLGKSLSPRVFIQYGVGLFQPISVFRFGYQLSRKFLLQGESGVESGADLIYSIDIK